MSTANPAASAAASAGTLPDSVPPQQPPPLFIRLSLPNGLEESLESLAREVLRSQPKNIYEFAAQHFEQQLRKRNKENGLSPDQDLDLFSVSSAVVASQPSADERNGSEKTSKNLDDGTQIESISGRNSRVDGETNQMMAVDADDDEALVEQARKMQSRDDDEEEDERRSPEEEEEEEEEKKSPQSRPDSSKKAIEIQMPVAAAAATAAGAAVAGGIVAGTVDEDEKSEGVDKEAEGDDALVEDVAKKPDEEEVDIDLEDPEVEKAASTIQAGYKGHKTRKEIKARKEILDEKENVPKTLDELNGKIEDDLVDIDLNDPEVEQAATKIQAGFKGHKTRKEMKEKKDVNDGERKEEKVEEAEEEIDIDLNDPEVEQAATKIQAGFKGHKTRKEMKEKKDAKVEQQVDEKAEETEEEIDIDINDPEVEQAATKIQAGFKGHKTRKEIKEKKDAKEVEQEEETKVEEAEEEIDIDLNDPEVEQAATKIQAGFKGHKTRKEMKEKKNAQDPEKEDKVDGAEAKEKGADEAEEIDIDLNDPEVEQAATKIQAGFKGHKARKEMKEKKDAAETGTVEEKADEAEEEINIDLNDPEVEQAATKIQAGFKGHKARKELKEKKDTKEGEKEEEKVVEEAEEEIDIDLNDPEVEQAATKIQAGFKGHKTRKEMKEMKDAQDLDKEEKTDEKKAVEAEEEIDIDLNDPEVEQAATKIQAGFKGHKTRKEMKEKKGATKAETDNEKKAEEEEVDIDLNDPEVEQAATKIQAGFKGHKTRKEMKEKKNAIEAENEDGKVAKAEEEEIDIDLNDPEVEQAATKIQAGFKGHKTRKEMKEKKDAKDEQQQQETKGQEAREKREEEEIDIDLDDPEVEVAATRIAAGYKGHKTRKEMKAKKAAEAGGKKEENQEGEFDVEKADSKSAAEADGDADAQDNADAEEVIDIDLDDPEVEDAATKIQAGFKGHQARKQVAARKRAMEEGGLAVGGNDDEPESLTIISEVRPGALKQDVADRDEDAGAIPFESKDKKDEDEEDREADSGKNVDLKKGDVVVEEGLVLNDSADGKNRLGAGGVGGGGATSGSSLESSLNKSGMKMASGDEEVPKQQPLMVYHYRASHNSQKLLMYLAEREIEFTAYHVDLQRGEHLSSWFLELNPRGEVPVVKFEEKVVADSTRIIHLLEARIPVDNHPPMVPCTSDTRLYQKHVYFTALIDQLPVNQLTHGLAFHPEFALCHASPPFDDPSHLTRLRQVVEGRPLALRQAAEEVDGAPACAELRRKALELEEETLPALRDVNHFEAMLEQAGNTLDKIEEQLEENMNLEDECPAWILGPSFTAVDISLSVALNRFAQMGLQRLWVNCERRRPRVERLLREAQKRPSFKKAVPDVGSVDGRPWNFDRGMSVGEAGAAAATTAMGEEEAREVLDEMEDAVKKDVQEEKKKLPAGMSQESTDIWNELKRGISKEEE